MLEKVSKAGWKIVSITNFLPLMHSVDLYKMLQCFKMTEYKCELFMVVYTFLTHFLPLSFHASVLHVLIHTPCTTKMSCDKIDVHVCMEQGHYGMSTHIQWIIKLLHNLNGMQSGLLYFQKSETTWNIRNCCLKKDDFFCKFFRNAMFIQFAISIHTIVNSVCEKAVYNI